MYKTTVVVDGMHCSMCESQVKSLVMKILPDAKLSASHRKGTLTVEGSFIPSGNLLRKALKDGGYEVKDISTEKIEKKAWFVLVFVPCLEISLRRKNLLSRESGFFQVPERHFRDKPLSSAPYFALLQPSTYPTVLRDKKQVSRQMPPQL